MTAVPLGGIVSGAISTAEPLARARDIVKRSNAITPSTALLHVDEEIRRGDTSASRLAKLIEGSPALAARVLRVANSGFYAPLQSVVSLPRAIAILGDVVLRQVVLASIVAARRPRNRSLRQSVVAARLMGDAVRSAVVCRDLARVIRVGDPDAAFAGGLLHDLGRVYLLDVVGDPFAECLVQRDMDPAPGEERSLCGASHEDVGEVLAADWDLPAPIAEAISAHHAPRPGSLAEVARVSDALVARLSRPVEPDPVSEPEADPLVSLGLALPAWDARVPAVRDQIQELMNLFD